MEFFRLNQVRTASRLTQKHVEKEASFLYELDLARTQHFFLWKRRHVHPRKAVDEQIPQSCKVAIPTKDLKAAESVDTVHCVLIVVAAARLVWIGDLKSLSFLHA